MEIKVALEALITQLETGSIKNAYTRGNYDAYKAGVGTNELLLPYILVYDDYPLDTYFNTENTIRPLIVDVHFPVGFVNQLNDYVQYELFTLLNRKRLTDNQGSVFQVFVTMNMSIMAEPNDDRSITGGNDDGTISRYRRIFIPRRGA